MNSYFKHKFSVITPENAHSPVIYGIMRKDNSAAILLPEYESYLKCACKLRFHKASLEIHDFMIEEYYRDNQRPLTKWLIKPIVVHLSLPEITET